MDKFSENRPLRHTFSGRMCPGIQETKPEEEDRKWEIECRREVREDTEDSDRGPR